MSKAKYRFLNDGEYETDIVLTEEQQSFLKFLLEWGFINDSVEIQEVEKEADLPGTYECPDCGSGCILVDSYGKEGIYRCDNCDTEFSIDFEEGF